MAQCNHIKENKQQCSAHAVEGTNPPRCYFHSSRGRRTNVRDGNVQELDGVDTSTISGVAQFLSKLMKAVACGDLDVKRSNALVYAASNLGRILEASELEGRVRQLEQRLEAQHEDY